MHRQAHEVLPSLLRAQRIDACLSPDFRAWSIEGELPRIACPLLAIQGLDDAYGTLRQVREIRRRLPATRVLELADCGHAVHRDKPAAVVAVYLDFWADDWRR